MTDRQIISTWPVLLCAAPVLLVWGANPTHPFLAFLAGVEVSGVVMFLYLKHLLRRLEATHD
jgi:hypothetical protein